MSLRTARNKVHKAEKNLESALGELDSDENVREEDFEEEIKDLISVVQDLKQIMRSDGQMDFRRF